MLIFTLSGQVAELFKCPSYCTISSFLKAPKQQLPRY